MLFQRTLRNRVCGAGTGLHSGRVVRFALLPAAPSAGIVFIRTDTHPAVEIPARAAQVTETRLATTLGRDGVTIGTVEHLLAALHGLGIDNARVELDGPEVPIMDGSAAPFVELIRAGGGTIAQSRPKRFVIVKRPIEVRDDDGERFARLEPASSFEIDCTVDFGHPLIRDQRFQLAASDRTFLREISRARTFGFARDVEAMRAAGLALGGSLENAVVVDDYSVQNPEGLRFPDEFVRHKVLDAIGDLALLGAPLIGRYVANKSGHALNTRLVAALLDQPRAYELAEFRHRREVGQAGLHLPAPSLGRLAAV
ncbi:MAG: UDP-3-O-acyl-N-acetylglucosamine deacetylase [Deltaproteobacteria bacterium]|nr:UDP-3-O-acyl-N-acetylglucosamine deacetylase [Deltaproteobacteria bacterium]